LCFEANKYDDDDDDDDDATYIFLIRYTLNVNYHGQVMESGTTVKAYNYCTALHILVTIHACRTKSQR